MVYTNPIFTLFPINISIINRHTADYSVKSLESDVEIYFSASVVSDSVIHTALRVQHLAIATPLIKIQYHWTLSLMRVKINLLHVQWMNFLVYSFLGDWIT